MHKDVITDCVEDKIYSFHTFSATLRKQKIMGEIVPASYLVGYCDYNSNDSLFYATSI